MSQRNIDFGSFPDDPSADAIRTAFRKTQENFTELFVSQQDQAVITVNKTPGAGITVNSPTGNVVVSAKIACVQIQSSTLGLGVSSGNTSNTAVITDGATPFIIDIPENLSNIGNISLNHKLTANTVNVNLQINGNTAVFTGNVSVGNLSTTGLTISGNVAVGNLSGGNAAFSGTVSTTLFTGTTANISANVNAGNVNAVRGNFSGNVNGANATLGNLVTANFFTGDGGLLTNVQATVSGISNGTSNARFATSGGNLLVSVAGNANVMVVSGAAVDIVGNLSATGNSNVGNLGAINGVYTGNISANNTEITNFANAKFIGVSTGALTSRTPAINVAATWDNVSVNQTGILLDVTDNGSDDNSLVMDLRVNDISQFNLNKVGNLSVNNLNGGNLVTANYFQGDGSLLTNISISAGSYIENGTSNVSIPVADGNATVSINGVSNVVVIHDDGITVDANINATVGISAVTLGGDLTTAAQPNVTSLGTLTGLTVNGVANLGAAGNIRITGGSNDQVLTSNGAGGVEWTTATSLTFAPGSNTQVLYNDQGNFAASAGMLFDNTSNTFTVDGTVEANLVTGTLTTAAQPNVTSVGTLTSLIVSGNTNSGNLYSANAAEAKFVNALSGSISNSTPAVNVTQIWNNASEIFTAIKSDITDTNSDSDSLLVDLQVASNSKFKVDKAGNVTAGYYFGNGSLLTGLSTTSLSNGTSNIGIPVANGNVNIGVNGNANVLTVTGTGAVVGSGLTNSIILAGAATTVSPTITGDGSDANVGISFVGKGNSTYTFAANGNVSTPMLTVIGSNNAVDYLQLTGHSAGNPGITATGSSTNVTLNLGAKGTGNISLWTGTSNVSAGGTEQFRILNTTNAVSRVQLTGAITAEDPYIGVGSGASDTGLRIAAKGAGNVTVLTNSTSSATGNIQFRVLHTANSNRYVTVTGSAGGTPTIGVAGGGANIAIGASTSIDGILTVGWSNPDLQLYATSNPTVMANTTKLCFETTGTNGSFEFFIDRANTPVAVLKAGAGPGATSYAEFKADANITYISTRNTGNANANIQITAGGQGFVNIATNAGNGSGGNYTGNVQFRVTHTANAARYVSVTGSASGNPTISVSAGNLAISNNVTITGNANISVDANVTGNIYALGTQITVGNPGNTNYASFTPATIVMTNSGTTQRINIGRNGNNIQLQTGTSSTTQVNITHTASAARTIDMTGSASGNPTISVSAGNLGFGSKLALTGNSSTFASIITNSTELVTLVGSGITGTINYDATTQSVLYYTANSSANCTLNIRASSGTTMNTALANGESITVVFMVTNGGTAYLPTTIQVDANTVTPKWQGGIAPTGGNANSIDAYTFTIIKTNTNTFTVLGAQTKFA